jgi:hypothetical protein
MLIRRLSAWTRLDHGRVWGVAATGDTIIFLVFAALGQAQHSSSEGPSVLRIIWTAMPFILGWFLSAYALNAIAKEGFKERRVVVRRTVMTWIGGCGVGLILRSILEGHVTPLPFVVVAFGFNLVLLILWHAALCLSPLRRDLQA